MESINRGLVVTFGRRLGKILWTQRVCGASDTQSHKRNDLRTKLWRDVFILLLLRSVSPSWLVKQMRVGGTRRTSVFSTKNARFNEDKPGVQSCCSCGHVEFDDEEESIISALILRRSGTTTPVHEPADIL